MNDRAQAIELLKQARDILAARLTERVLESAEEILADAQGESYLSEIESIHDEVGVRLVHISQMISNLPAIQEPADDQFSAAYGDEPADVRNDSPEPRSPLALPAPSSTVATQPPVAASFRAFAMAIQLNDVDGAGRQLAGLFSIAPARARECAVVFLKQLRRDPDFLAKARQLRQELATGSNNGAIMLLHECFGLQAMESIGVVQTLRVRISQLD